jgi:prefoldin subunit 5
MAEDKEMKSGYDITGQADADPASKRSESQELAAAQLEELTAELERLKESVAAVASTARGFAATRVETTIADVEEALKRNVFISVGTAFFIGYVWGRSR